MKLNKASGNKFQMVFPKLPFHETIEENKILNLNIFSFTLPGISISESDHNWLGSKQKMTDGEITYNNLTIGFNIDEDFLNWQIIFDWIVFINNGRNKFIENKDTFTVETNIIIYDNYFNTIKTIIFNGLFPYELGDVDFNKREGEGYLESSCSFLYDYYTIL